MQQKDIIRSMISYIDNEYRGKPWGAVEEEHGFINGVLWTIKKLQNAGHFETNDLDLGELYREMMSKYSRKK